MEDKNIQPNEIKQLVSATKNDIKELKTTLNEIQDTCKHKEVTIRNISTGVAELRKVCDTCEKILGFPTREQLREAGY